MQSLNERDLQRHGLHVSPQAPPIAFVDKAVKGRSIVRVPEGIDPGFAYNPGEAGLAIPR